MIPKYRAWHKVEKYMGFVDIIDYKHGQVNIVGADIAKFEEVVLMQSTEINGLEISDGDIVHVLDSVQINQKDENGAYVDAFFEELDEIDHVVFDNGGFKLKRTGLDVYICQSVEEFKVIGNIYENPELIKIR